MITPANVCAHNHHNRASEGNGAAAERPRGAISSPWSPALPDARPAGAELPGRGSAAGRTGKKEVLKKRCNTRTSEERASEGNGAAAERHRGAHLLAIEPRPSGCPTRRSRASGTRVGGWKDG
ncbi:hypothetical protein PIB30_109653 [Stylosanthes scabra]|uniref:Uncharacterized protein n=1 Tax=Stylosanthes scabra TaxID=79078 RepID=A0ABU6TZ72_9FABA|nr:hypothetical protein [Stylosanthes scabra]